MFNRRTLGFTLIELMIVIAIIAIVATIAIPNMLSSRMAANESAAISTLRQFASSQAEVKTAYFIDGDGDGVGEYAYFGELAGTHFVRAFIGGAQAISPSAKVEPPVASAAFGNVQNSKVKRSGCYFQVWLPDAAGVGAPEFASGGADPGAFPDPDLCEVLWCAYAWPASRGNSSNRAFFINQQGDILQCSNSVKKYDGSAVMPLAGAAYIAGGMADVISLPTANTTVTKLGQDGEVWTNVN